jgi:LacI family transcriptional regulator
MATIFDVAKSANVSTATVSNVLNNTSKVKDTTRARVLQAATELGYTQNAGAGRSRRKESSQTIGVIVEDLTIFNTPEIVDAIGETLSGAEYSMLLMNLRLARSAGTLNFDDSFYIEPATAAVNALLAKEAEGIIYVGSQSREIRHISAGYSTPFIYAYCFSNESSASSVIYDDIHVSYELVQFLIKNGHRKIGIIKGPEHSIHVRDRLLGAQNAFFEGGILYNPGFVYTGDWDSAQTGYDAAAALIPKGISAIFCMNDITACGVLDYALTNGVRVPRDLSVVGFDDIEAARYCYPKLTTVALPLKEIGLKAAELMLNKISNRSHITDPDIITMPCHIVHRDSCNVLVE